MIFIETNIYMIIVILIGTSFALLIISLSCLISNRKLTKQYKVLTSLTGEVDLVSIITNNQDNIEKAYKKVVAIEKELVVMNNNLDETFQKMSIVKYNAFEGMGAQLSAVIVLMNKEGSGILLNSIHTNTGSHMYSKAINKGKTEQALSPEEKKAIQEAIN